VSSLIGNEAVPVLFCLRGTLHWIELVRSCQFSLSGVIAYMAKYPIQRIAFGAV
jgi:hypothetical protein